MQVIVPLKSSDIKSFEAQYKKTLGKAHVIEVWLDQIKDLDTFLEDFEDFRKDKSEFFLGVCKSVEEGGQFKGTSLEKSQILDHFLKFGGDGVDFDIARNPLKIMAPFPHERLWLSFHDYQGVPEDLETIMLGMYVLEPSIYKFSVTVDTQEALDLFLEFVNDFPPHIHGIFTTMGKLGKVGRQSIGDKSWGAFYALDEKNKTAEGQPTLADL
ncbi:MAG TPA: type I 3-dehydroquinate dehydratase [Candidatus Gracilibacteria bacterium]